MIDLLSVFTKGGAVLWMTQAVVIKGSPIAEFIRQILLQDKIGSVSSLPFGDYTLKWTFANDLNLVFVAVFLNFPGMFDVDAFLEELKGEFVDTFRDAFKVVGSSSVPLLEEYKFDANYKKLETKFKQMRLNGVGGPGSNSGPGQTFVKKKNERKEEKKGDSSGEEGDAEESAAAISGEQSGEESYAPVKPLDKKAIEAKLKGKGKKVGKSSTKAVEEVSTPTEGATKKKGKEKRNWKYPAGGAVDAKNLNFSRQSSDEVEVEKVAITKEDSEEEVESDPEEEEEVKETGAAKKSSGGLFSYFSGLIGGRPLTKEDLAKPLEGIRQSLLAKNVASNIADQICDSVSESLEGKKLPNFTSVKSLVKTTMEETLTRVLTPKRHIDVVREIKQARSEGRPYSVVFVGVNGVGKSTSLAKICYYLRAREFKVSIAACDTFRSGAVEQLNTHARRLGVEVFQQGYNKDASAVAAEGIRNASRKGDDVVLIDTAGRMQDNQKLMIALAKLIAENKPDLILFVGEALVGNDAVDQLVKFNRALADLSQSANPRLIDGIVLTKFDTVDDKVGSAISMTYTTGQPILFVGVGQDYGDIRRLSVKALIHKLLK